MRASRILGLALAVAAVGLLATTPGMANCLTGGSVYQGFAGFGFSGCGDNAVSFIWAHQHAVQRLVSGATSNGAAGADSGTLSTVTDGLLTPGTAEGEYFSGFDWGFSGPDGCIVLYTEADTALCAYAPTFGGTVTGIVNNFAVAGQDPANPLNSLAVVASVDFDETFQAWVLDQAGALSLGDPCSNDSAGFNTVPITCGALPTPGITTFGACDGSGCTLNITIPPNAAPILNDCNVANSAPLDCTGPAGDERNLYVGRELFVKRAPCNATASPATFDTRTFIMDPTALPFPGTATPNFVPYSPEDLNLNGIVDAGETGPFTFVRLTDNTSQTVPVHIPKISGAPDCVYLGVGVVYDKNPISPGENVFSPRVSVNPTPISLDTATPASDRVIDLVASKTAGKAAVSWETTAELATAGFNVIGVKKNGSEVKLNSSLIAAKQGTTGTGASYSASFGSGDLKGSSQVYVELVKTNGAKERFGPASF